MGLADDFKTEIMPRINTAISYAMYAFEQPLKEQINLTSGNYDGPRSRRTLFGGGTYEAQILGDSILITNITPMQGTNQGIPEVDFVEQGLDTYHMPYPRPFMEEAATIFAKGEGEHILQTYLDAYV